MNITLQLVNPPATSGLIVTAWKSLPKPPPAASVDAGDLRRTGRQLVTTSRTLPAALIEDAWAMANGNKGGGIRAMLGLYGIDPYASYVHKFEDGRKPIAVSIYLPARYHVPQFYSFVGTLLDECALAWAQVPQASRDRAEETAYEAYLGEEMCSLRVRIAPRTYAICQSVAGNASEGARRILATVERFTKETA